MEQQSIQWRRDKVQELSSQGNSQREIAKTLQVGIGTINRDLTYLRQQAKQNIRRRKAARRVREMSGWFDCNTEGSMEYLAAGRRQERKDTSFISS